MKKYILYRLFCLVTFILTSCALQQIPLKNSYNNESFELETSTDFDTVWENIIELFAKNGIGIKLIDKKSGFIIANNTLTSITTEDDDGNLIDPNAWAVSEKYIDPGSRKIYYPYEALIEWNIHIKEKQNQTIININLIDINNKIKVIDSHNNKRIINNTELISTHVFENEIAKKIN